MQVERSGRGAIGQRQFKVFEPLAQLVRQRMTAEKMDRMAGRHRGLGHVEEMNVTAGNLGAKYAVGKEANPLAGHGGVHGFGSNFWRGCNRDTSFCSPECRL